MAHILIIEDDALLRRMLRLTLEKLGYDVTEASDGREGLTVQKSAVCDLVLVDIVMPEIDGIKTIIELKRESPALKIIAMSGGGRGNASDYLTMASKLGANRTLAKPFSAEELSTLIAEVLQSQCPLPRPSNSYFRLPP